MNAPAFKGWLDSYSRAWKTHDSALIGELFTERAVYHIRPFEEPLRGRPAIVDYWMGIAETQTDVRFHYEILGYTSAYGVAHWAAEFTRTGTGKRVQLDGVLTAMLDGDNRCSIFREWWHSQEAKPEL
jgi:hypothetical protein